MVDDERVAVGRGAVRERPGEHEIAVHRRVLEHDPFARRLEPVRRTRHERDVGERPDARVEREARAAGPCGRQDRAGHGGGVGRVRVRVARRQRRRQRQRQPLVAHLDRQQHVERDADLAAGRDAREPCGEQVRALLLDEARHPSARAGSLERLARRLAPLHAASDDTLADAELEPAHGGVGRQREEVGAVEPVVGGVPEGLRQGQLAEQPLDVEREPGVEQQRVDARAGRSEDEGAGAGPRHAVARALGRRVVGAGGDGDGARDGARTALETAGESGTAEMAGVGVGGTRVRQRRRERRERNRRERERGDERAERRAGAAVAARGRTRFAGERAERHDAFGPLGRSGTSGRAGRAGGHAVGGVEVGIMHGGSASVLG